MHKKAAALASAVPKSALVGEREKQFYVTIFSRAKMDLDIARNRTSFGSTAPPNGMCTCVIIIFTCKI